MDTPKKLFLSFLRYTKDILMPLTLLCSIAFSLFWVAGCASTASTVLEKPKGEYFWPKPPASPRIKWLTQWSNRYDFGKPSEVMEFLVGKERIEKLRRPTGVVADSAGNVYVTDTEMRIIFVFDVEKNSLRFLGLGSFASPVGLAIDNSRGILYIADSRLHKIFGMNKKTGDVVLTLGGLGQFKNPSGLAFNEEKGWLYVADTQNHIVRVFDRDGMPVFTIGQRGKEAGEFNFPSYLAIDRDQRLYVVDSFNFRVQIFDAEGKFLKKFGKMGDTSGSFSRPIGIGIDSEGHIYVVDSSFANFQIFNDEGRLLLWVGNAGTAPGEFYLPAGLFIDSSDRIYVADTFNRRIQVFQYLKTGDLTSK